MVLEAFSVSVGTRAREQSGGYCTYGAWEPIVRVIIRRGGSVDLVLKDNFNPLLKLVANIYTVTPYLK